MGLPEATDQAIQALGDLSYELATQCDQRFVTEGRGPVCGLRDLTRNSGQANPHRLFLKGANATRTRKVPHEAHG